jgi:hypothetical protein
MNTKSLMACFVAMMLSVSVAIAAGMHGGGGAGGHGGGHAMVGGRGGFAHGPMGTFHGNHWNGNWHHHGHDHDDFIFFGGFGWPYWGWGYPGYYWGYPYGYPPYPYYPYGYYGGGYYGYNRGYYGGGGYASHTSVVSLQQRLAHAGFYHGHIDGKMGPQTRSALRAYQHAHSTANNGPVYGRPM